MKIVGVIAEFNPFHNGHARLISHAKKNLGADYIVAVMSGDFVQRGEPALLSRHSRAAAALSAGFDLVLSLPVGISTASAEGFAEGGIRALASLGCVDTLLFGSEAGNLERLRACAHALLTETPEQAEALQAALKKGLSYPQARAEAFPDYADLLSAPNNILAIEYLKAIEKMKLSLEPKTLLRTGNYHADDSSKSPSAETIRRRAIIYGSSSISLSQLAKDTMPSDSAYIFFSDITANGLVTAEDFSLLLALRLFSALSYEEYLAFAGVGEDLARRIFEKRTTYLDYESFVNNLRSKNTTRTAICRALLSILLAIPKGGHLSLPCLRVLGYRKEAQPLLQEIAAHAEIPILFRPAEAEKLAENAEKEGLESSSLAAHIRREIMAANLYEVVRAQKAGRFPRTDTNFPVYRI